MEHEMNEDEVREYFAQKQEMEEDYSARAHSEDRQHTHQSAIQEDQPLQNDEVITANIQQSSHKINQQYGKIQGDKHSDQVEQTPNYQQLQQPITTKQENKKIPEHQQEQQQNQSEIQRQPQLPAQKQQQKAEKLTAGFKPIPVPPIDISEIEEPELRSIWEKIAQLQQMVGASSNEQLENKTLQIFMQAEDFFSSFL